MLRQLLAAVAGLAEWRPCLVTHQDRCRLWMGPDPQAATEPGSFQREQIGHFVLLGPDSKARDLYPLLCFLPDAEQEQRLHFYDSIFRYQEKRKEVSVLEYDNGFKHASQEPIPGLEQAFTTELLKKAFQRHQGRMEVIEGRVANFGELLVEHADIVGRRFVIDHVQRFIEQHDRGLLVIQAEPGKGKTALMCHLIEEVFGHYSPQPVHFFYRRTAGITDPDVCVRSLYHALLQAHNITETDESRQQTSPEGVHQKLTNLLADSIAPRLSPSRPQLILIDALDEAEPTAAGRTAFERIPENLPTGVHVIATTRPVTHRAGLAQRAHTQLYDLDSPDLVQDNLRDGADYVRRELVGSELASDTLDEIARVGRGNFLVLKLLIAQVGSRLEPDQVREYIRGLASDSGQGQLGFIYQEFWNRLTARLSREDTNLVCDVAGLLVTARAPVTAEMICACLRLRDGDWEFALRHLAEYLTVIEQREEGEQETYYRIYHESFADFLRSRVTRQRERYEGLLADFCLGWSNLPPDRGRLYALRFGPDHLRAAARWSELSTLLTDIFFLEAKAAAGMTFELVGDYFATVAAMPDERPEKRLLQVLEEALRRDIHFINHHAQDYPQALFQCLWNTCWWYGCEQPVKQYEPLAAAGSNDAPTCGSAGAKMRELLSTWRACKEQAGTGFRWLRSLLPPVLPVGSAQFAVLRANMGRVKSVTFSPDGGVIASGSFDNTVRLWNATDGSEVAVLRGHEDEVTSVAFSPDGAVIASGSFDNTVRLWDAASGSEVALLNAHEGAVTSVMFSPNGRRIASGSDDETVRIWDVTSGAELVILRATRALTYAIASSPDGRLEAGGSEDFALHVWDTQTAIERAVLFGHESPIVSVVFFPDNRLIASGSEDLTVRVWDVEKGIALAVFRKEDLTWGSRKEDISSRCCTDGGWVATYHLDGAMGLISRGSSPTRARLRGLRVPISSVAFSPNGLRIVAASMEGMIRVWDSESGGLLGVLRGHEDSVTNVLFSPDGRRIISGSFDGTVRVWDTETFEQLAVLVRHEESVLGMAFSPDGRRIVSGGWDKVRVWEVGTGAESAIFQHEDNVLSVAFAPDGRRIVSGSEDQTVRLWTLTDESARRTPHGCETSADEVFFSPDGRRVAAHSFDSADAELVPVWDSESGVIIGVLRGHEEPVTSVAFSPDSRRIVTGSYDGTVRVWDTETFEELAVLVGHRKCVVDWDAPVVSVAFSPDGRRIASGGPDGIRIWDALSARELAVMGEPKDDDDGDAVYFITFSPDGRRLAVVGVLDITVWDLDTGTKAAVLGSFQGDEVEGDEPVRVAFFADGRRIVSESRGGTARVWDVSSGACLEEVDGLGDIADIASGGFPWRAISSGVEIMSIPHGTGQCHQGTGPALTAPDRAGRIGILFLFHDPDIAEADGVAVVLEIDRSRLRAFRQRGRGGRPRDRDVLEHLHSVMPNGHPRMLHLLAAVVLGSREIHVVGLPGKRRIGHRERGPGLRRIKLPGQGPRALAVTGSKIYVSEYFSDTLAVVDHLARPDAPLRAIALGDKPPLTAVRRGELLFNDATICHQHWQSCASCHPDGRSICTMAATRQSGT